MSKKDIEDIENSESLEAMRLAAADRLLEVRAEIAKVASEIASYNEFEFSDEKHFHAQIAKIVDDKAISQEQRLERVVPWLKRCRIYYLKQVASFYEKENPGEKDLAVFETNLANLEKLPPVDFFESLIAKAKSGYEELQAAQSAVMDETDRKLNTSLNKEVRDIFARAFNGYLATVQNFIGRDAEYLPPDFDKSLGLLESSIMKAKEAVEESSRRQEADIKKLEQVVQDAELQIASNKEELQKAQEKDNKPLRRFVRFVTGGRAAKKADLTSLNEEIKEGGVRLAEAHENLSKAKDRFAEIEAQKYGALRSVETSYVLTHELKEGFTKEVAVKDLVLDKARGFFSALKNNIFFKRKVAQEKQSEEVAQRQKEELKARQKDLGSRLSDNFDERTTIARLVEKGAVRAKTTKTEKAIEVAKTAVEYIPVPVVAQALQVALSAASMINDAKNAKATKRIAEFQSNPNSKEILQQLSQRLSTDSSSLVVAEESRDDFVKAVGRKVMQGIGGGSIKITDQTEVGEAVDMIVGHLQKERKVVGKTKIKLEGGKEGTVEGYLSRQAVEVFDEARNEHVILVPKSRGEDLKGGKFKYGVRPATPEEQEKYNKDGKLKGRKEYVAKEKDPDSVSVGDISIGSFDSVDSVFSDASSITSSQRSESRLSVVSDVSDVSRDSKDSGYDSPSMQGKKPQQSKTTLKPEDEKKLEGALQFVTLKDGVDKEEAFRQIARIIKDVAQAVRDHKIKPKDVDETLKTQMSEVLVVGSRNFARVANKDRVTFNAVKEAAAVIVASEAKERPSILQSVTSRQQQQQDQRGGGITA